MAVDTKSLRRLAPKLGILALLFGTIILIKLPIRRRSATSLTFGQAGAASLELTQPTSRQKRIFTDADCTAAYPDLYHSIDRAVAYWGARNHTITEQDYHPVSQLTILVNENTEARVVSADAHTSERILSLVILLKESLDEATAAGEKLPTIEAVINVNDRTDLVDETDDTHTVWGYTQNSHEPYGGARTWLIPDHTLYSNDLQTFEQSLDYARHHDRKFTEKIPQAYWYGVTWTNAMRATLIKATAGKSWANVTEMDWADPQASFIPPDRFCDYAITLHTEGFGQSGRLGQLLQCNSVMIAPESLEWSNHYVHLLKSDGPLQNYVSVKRDWSNLEEKVQWLLQNPEEAERIIRNSLALFRDRYISTQATRCYMRKLIQGYGAVSSRPRLFKDARPDDGAYAPRRHRGTSLNAFMISSTVTEYREDKALI